MPTSKDFLTYILDQLPAVTARPMMGEYILYRDGRIIGGLYDNRFLVKPTPSARKLMPDAPEEQPYDGAKPMLLVEDADDRDFLEILTRAMIEELPEPKTRK